jgi:hypothetical protein
MSRLDNLAQVEDATQDSDKFAAYTYLGAGTIVEVLHPAVTEFGGHNTVFSVDGF